jgi:hypothetical protein
MRTAQPMCRLGIAAYWFTSAPLVPSYADGPYVDIVSRNPQCGNIRGGASGKTMCATRPSRVRTTRRRRAQRYSERGRATKPHTRNAMVTGKWAER